MKSIISHYHTHCVADLTGRDTLGFQIFFYKGDIHSTPVISNSNGLYETLRDIRTSTYQICGTEENNLSNNHI